jgi:hypothetical protein
MDITVPKSLLDAEGVHRAPQKPHQALILKRQGAALFFWY